MEISHKAFAKAAFKGLRCYASMSYAVIGLQAIKFLLCRSIKKKQLMEQTSTPNFSNYFSKKISSGISDLNHAESEQWKLLSQILDKRLRAPSETSLRIIRDHSVRTSHLLEA
jgi:hypothetical protein